jgi:hypothetical protein
MRVPVFIIYALFTCCCEKGNIIDNDNFPFDKLILSYKYISKREEEIAALQAQGINAEDALSDPWVEWRT